MPDWLQPTFLLLPFAAWMFLGAGLPWALALLPRGLWRERITVLALSMALGPLNVTAVMFALGTAGRLTLAGTLAGSGALAALGAALAARQVRRSAGERVVAQPAEARNAPPAPRSRGERALIAGIALLMVINVLVTAYWPFIAYDVQWVYGYNARIFTLEERIPSRIGYYPQLVPLGYTYFQQAWAALGHDALNDHAARVLIPWVNLGMVLMAWVLGWLVFGRRRVALLTAAIWAFYPHVAAWAGAGDLEIALTLYMTGAAAFFVAAWRSGNTRLALVAGVLLGGALWTKPNAGALALGVMLIVAAEGARLRLRWKRWWPRLRLALIMALATVPLGALWYVRNLWLGHAAVVFPASYWHDFAQRSGQELGWPLLLAALAGGGLVSLANSRRERWLPVLALTLLLAGTLPTAINWERTHDLADLWQWLRGDQSAERRMSALEWMAVLTGAALLVWAGRHRWRAWSRERWTTVGLLWGLALPYALVWFLDYSYHYRLSFAIVPLMAVQAAALIDGWLWDWLAASRRGRGVGTAIIAGALAVAVAAGTEHTVNALRDGGLADDTAKYDRGNPALMVVVHMLERYAAEHGEPVVAIPGEDRLPFFFPTWEIRNSRAPDELPTRLEDLEGVDVFVNTSVGIFLMQWSGQWPNSLQADADLAALYHQLDVRTPDSAPWPTVLEPIPLSPDGSLPVDDGNFRYTAFTVHPEARFAPMTPSAPATGEAVFGDWAQFIGYDLGNLKWQRGERVVLTLYWRPTDAAPPPRDYSVFVHLLSPDGELLTTFDAPPAGGTYPTRFWRPGESILDYRVLRIPADLPPGPAHLRIGVYDPLSLERLPLTLDGEPAGDGLILETRIVVK